MRPRMVVLDGATLAPGDNPWTPVDVLGDLVLFDRTAADEVVPRLRGATIAIVNKVQLTAAVLAELPDLQLIAVTATGFDCVDGVAARRQGVLVANVPTYGTDSVAQFTFALLLELCHRVAWHDAAIRAGEWQRCGSFAFWKTPQVELAGLTLGIIGFGRIGRRVGEIGHALGMSVLASDPQQAAPPDYQPFGWGTIEDVASQSDVVTLHCNLTESDRGLVNANFLGRMRPSAVLINAARGALVDEQALADALNTGRIAGAALDVVAQEPIGDDNPLLTARNCLLTPHMAWSTLAARRRIMQSTAENIRQFLAGTPIHVVN